MKHYKAIIKTICFVLLFCIINKVLCFLTVDDTNSYTRIMMHEFYYPDSNIDVLFLGGSHCYRSLDTRITDKVFRRNTFNAGSSNQSADGTYSLLCEAVKRNKVQKVYVEVGYAMPRYETWYKARTQMTGTYIISDYMKPSYDKVRFLLQASSAEHYANSFFPARRSWEKFFHPAEMLKLLQKKLSKEYREYGYVVNENEEYCGKGFVGDDTEIPKGGFYSMEEYQKIEDSRWSEDWQESIKQVIQLCEERDISLTFFSAPMPDFLLVASGDYDKYIEFMDALLEGSSARYYDFNLCKPQYLSLAENDFKDDNHLNTEGAEVFSKLFSEYFAGDLSGEDIFYGSYREKLAAQKDTVYGVVVQDNKEDGYLSLEAVTNAGSTKEISYIAERTDRNGQGVIQKNSICELLPYGSNETGTVDIRVYFKGVETNHISVPYGAE